MTHAHAFEQWMFERHSREDVAQWAPSLKFFRYCRAYGGHMGDGDELKVALRYESESRLASLCKQLGVVLAPMPAHARRPVAGKAYSSREYAEFIPFIRHLPHLQQPGHLILDGVRAYVHVLADRIELGATDADAPYEVTARCIEGARALESRVAPLKKHLVDPPRDDRHCLCPQFYPELWRPRG